MRTHALAPASGSIVYLNHKQVHSIEIVHCLLVRLKIQGTILVGASQCFQSCIPMNLETWDKGYEWQTTRRLSNETLGIQYLNPIEEHTTDMLKTSPNIS